MLAAIAILLALAVVAKGSTKTASASGATGHRDLSEVSSYDVRGYKVVTGMGEDGLWDWRVWESAVYESGADIDGQEAAQGFDESDETAALAAAQEWVNAQHGGPLGVSVPSSARGLRVSSDCSEISVVDIEEWIAYATPLIKSYDVADPQAEDVMRLTFDAAFPDCGFRDPSAKPSIRGTSWDTTAARMQSTIDQVRAGELLSVQRPEEVVAARAVAMSPPSIPGSVAEWHEGANNGNVHAIVVTPNRPKDDYLWRVWIGPRRDREDIAKFGFSPTRAQALADAKGWADQYFNVGADASEA